MSDDVVGGWLIDAQNRDRAQAKIEALSKALSDTEAQLAQCQQQLATDALQFASRIVALEQDLARLRSKLEAANAALGEHPDTELDLAARISELRDEGRAYFHENTRLRQELEHWKASYEGKSLDEKEFLRLKQENATLRKSKGCIY
jgi:chromosome segregation ATPase